MTALVVTWAITAALSCIVLLHGAVMLARRCPQLASLRPPDPATWPRLGVVVPACDETPTIEPALASLIATQALRAPLPVLLASLPLGDLAMAWIVGRATVPGVRRGGLVWRGTDYPTAALRAGRRVDM